jgi:Rieske Fe-S protein
MAGEDQERFEDYLELERYIAELQAGRVAHPPTDLTPERARIYRMAAFFRSASPEAAKPSSEFAEVLRTRLLAMDEEAQQDLPQGQPQVAHSEQPVAVQRDKQEIQPPQTNQSRAVPKKARFVQRRSLLTGGAAAAASLLVGAGIGAAIEHAGASPVAATHSPYSNTPIVPKTIPTKLQHVTTLTKLGTDAVFFKSDALVGYVIRGDGDESWADQGGIIAMSASCTHMGCTVQWQNSDRRFHCPCHGGMFTQDGLPDKSGRMSYLAALPRLETVIKGDDIYVVVPDVSSL